MKKIIKGIFNGLGIEVMSRSTYAELMKPKNPVIRGNDSTQNKAMKRLIGVGISPDLVIDVGAAKGVWTTDSLTHFPNANYVLIEPIKEQIEHMDPSLRSSPNITVVNAVAGSEKGEVKFNITPDLDGSGVYADGIGEERLIPVVRLDEVTEGKPGRILLKLDTHGYELPILEGCSGIWGRMDCMIIEVYGFHVSPTGPLFHELSAFLAEKGFRLYDVVDFVRRKKDNAFWQADAVYLRSDSKVFQDNSYS